MSGRSSLRVQKCKSGSNNKRQVFKTVQAKKKKTKTLWHLGLPLYPLLILDPMPHAPLIII